MDPSVLAESRPSKRRIGVDIKVALIMGAADDSHSSGPSTLTMIHLDRKRSPRDLLPAIARLFALSAVKIQSLEDT
jgi:hypothetical protein